MRPRTASSNRTAATARRATSRAAAARVVGSGPTTQAPAQPGRTPRRTMAPARPTNKATARTRTRLATNSRGMAKREELRAVNAARANVRLPATASKGAIPRGKSNKATRNLLAIPNKVVISSPVAAEINSNPPVRRRAIAVRSETRTLRDLASQPAAVGWQAPRLTSSPLRPLRGPRTVKTIRIWSTRRRPPTWLSNT